MQNTNEDTNKSMDNITTKALKRYEEESWRKKEH